MPFPGLERLLTGQGKQRECWSCCPRLTYVRLSWGELRSPIEVLWEWSLLTASPNLVFLPEAKSFFIRREALLEPFGVHLGVVGLRHMQKEKDY